MVTPFAFGFPSFGIVMILTFTVVMIVVMIESTGMLLALSDMTDKPINQNQLAAGLRTDGLGTVIGGIFNTFPHTSFSQNVGLVAVTGVKSRWVCVAGGLIRVVLGMLPKMAAFVEAIPLFVLGGAGLVMFGMVAATARTRQKTRPLPTLRWVRQRRKSRPVRCAALTASPNTTACW